jgi:hypothetical protein
MKRNKLPESLKGKGSTKGFTFTRLTENDYCYLYKVDSGHGIHFETFQKKTRPVLIDFVTKTKSEDEVEEYYPSDEKFGEWAYCCYTLERAEMRMQQLTEKAMLSEANKQPVI